jgi:hypothetical protein
MQGKLNNTDIDIVLTGCRVDAYWKDWYIPKLRELSWNHPYDDGSIQRIQ